MFGGIISMIGAIAIISGALDGAGLKYGKDDGKIVKSAVKISVGMLLVLAGIVMKYAGI